MGIDVSRPGVTLKEAVDRLTIAPLTQNDPRYVDCSEVRGKNVVAKLASILWSCAPGKYVHQIFTGYRGDGKSTEINRFMAEIVNNGYRPLYFNAEEVFDLNDFKLTDFLLGIAKVVFDRMNQSNLPLDNSLIEKVANWFASIVEVVEQKTTKELKAEVGAGISWFQFITAKLLGTIKTGGERRQEIRKQLNQEITRLLHHVDELLIEACKVSKAHGNKNLVVILDNLDRLQPELAYDLFYLNGGKLVNLKCHFFYVAPIALVYGEKAKLEPPLREIITMKMIPIKDMNNKVIERNVAHLRALLEKRFVPEKILAEPDATLSKFILGSGGHLRDLIRFLHQACTDTHADGKTKITNQIAQRVINEACEGYQQEVRQEAFYNNLIRTYKSKRVVVYDDITRELIFRNLILVYDNNGTDWFDVHPVLTQGQVFQDKEKLWTG